MRWYFKKIFIVLCILQIVRCMQNEEPLLGTEFTENLAGDILDVNEVINSVDIDLLSELVTDGSGENLTTKLTTEVEETTIVSLNEAEDQGETTTEKTEKCIDDCSTDSILECLCDCKTGALLGISENNQCKESSENEITTNKNVDEMTTAAANEILIITTTKIPEKHPRFCKMIDEIIPSNNSCHSYYICSPTSDGLQKIEQNCPSGTAYNAKLRRCARDLATCKNDEPSCLTSGTLADGDNNSTYIWCVPDMSGQTFHKYRVRCASYEVFLPELGTCYIDVEKIKNGNTNFYQQHDIDMIKAELEEFKIMEKAQLKEQKRKLKFEKNLQKALIKKAIKDAKERAKLEGKDSKEMENFVCMQEGNFKSPLGENFYRSCISKKGKLKEITMICETGTNFDEITGICV